MRKDAERGIDCVFVTGLDRIGHSPEHVYRIQLRECAARYITECIGLLFTSGRIPKA
jgi:hypothetical protein